MVSDRQSQRERGGGEIRLVWTGLNGLLYMSNIARLSNDKNDNENKCKQERETNRERERERAQSIKNTLWGWWVRGVCVWADLLQ